MIYGVLDGGGSVRKVSGSRGNEKIGRCDDRVFLGLTIRRTEYITVDL